MEQKSPLSKETLTQKTYDQIYSYCLRRLPDRESAEDTAQEVFCAFWEGPEFTDGRVALGWLYRVAAKTELNARFLVCLLQGPVKLVRVERGNLVTGINVNRRIFLRYNINRSA